MASEDLDLRYATANLLKTAGMNGPFSLLALPGGANNRVFRVDTNGSSALLKAYFGHGGDRRDRLGAEFSFASFAWQAGLRCLPRPFACSRQNRLGLYEFVVGRQLRPHEVTEDAVRHAINFYRDLNRHKGLPGARTLSMASEAYFTIADHLGCLEQRLRDLRNVNDSSAIDREAHSFISSELAEAVDRVDAFSRRRAGELGLTLDGEIALGDRCLSPSDFGFHNAILADDGSLRFIDFEYAGWDDPGKMVCDFFCQPAVPVPAEHYRMVVEAVISDLSDPEMHAQRIALLLPVYRLKWCCILLNNFLPAGASRRRFARGPGDEEEQKVRQLQKARRALQSLADESG